MEQKPSTAFLIQQEKLVFYDKLYSIAVSDYLETEDDLRKKSARYYESKRAEIIEKSVEDARS